MAIRVPSELTERDPAVLAPAAGLRFVPDDEPGLTRRGGGDRVVYEDAFGKAVRDRSEIERIAALAIPPAWRSVWICASPDGHLLASGLDDAGRKQYRYHPLFREHADHLKFERLRYFGRAIVEIRKSAAQGLRQPIGSREHAVSAAITLIDRCLLRVGNHRSAANGHYGATTLTVEHVVVDSDGDSAVTLEYTAKSGQERTVVVDDDGLADTLIDLADDADDELFWFDVPTRPGGRRRADADDINRFVELVAGPAFSAKDFRTWGGSAAALNARVEGADEVRAVDAAAAELGNTRAVARSAYVHPSVTSTDEELLRNLWLRSRSSRWMDRSERTLAKLLAGGGS